MPTWLYPNLLSHRLSERVTREAFSNYSVYGSTPPFFPPYLLILLYFPHFIYFYLTLFVWLLSAFPSTRAAIKPLTEGTFLFIAESPVQEQDLTYKHWLDKWISDFSVEFLPSVLQRSVNMDIWASLKNRSSRRFTFCVFISLKHINNIWILYFPSPDGRCLMSFFPCLCFQEIKVNKPAQLTLLFA